MLLVVWGAGENIERAVDLLGENKAHQLMRIGHFAERHAKVRSRADALVHAAAAADNESDFGRGQVSAVDCRRKLGASEFFAADIQQHDVAAKPPKYRVALEPHLRFARLVRKLDDGKLDVIVMQYPADGKIMKVLPKFIKGKHMNLPITHHFVCEEVSVEGDYPVELDGEIYENLKLDCKVVKNGLRTFVVK